MAILRVGVTVLAEYAFIVSFATKLKVQCNMSEHQVLELDRFLPYRLSVLSNRLSMPLRAATKRASSSR
jgi:hypothetical protein